MVPPLAYFASGGNYPILGSPAPLSPTIPAVRPSRLTRSGANALRMNKGLGTYCSDSSPDCLNEHEGELTGTLIVLLTPVQVLGVPRLASWGELSNDQDEGCLLYTSPSPRD